MRLRGADLFTGVTLMGHVISEALGERAYAAAVNSYSGIATMPTGMGELPPGEPGSLEAVLHDQGSPFGFVDLRGLPQGHELRQPRPGRIFGNLPRIVADWSRVTDGVLFIDTMAASNDRRDS